LADFNKLTLIEKKKILFELIDVNTLYVNYSDIDSEEYNTPANEKNFMNSFYKGE